MAEQPRKKKPVKKKKPNSESKGFLGFGKKNADAKPQKTKKDKKQKEETVAGNGQILQAKGALLGKVVAWSAAIFVVAVSTLTVINLLNPPATAEQVVENTDDPTSQQAGEYARGYVGSWLRATSEDDTEISRYMPVGREDITEEEPTTFRDLAVASVDTGDNGITTVIIAAEIETVIEDPEDTSTQDEDEDAEESEEESSEEEEANQQDEDEEDPMTEWVPTWYQVNIFHAEGTFTPLGWPAPVPSPQTGDAPRMEYQYAGSEELESTITAFFEAYALEEGDVTRLTHPGSTIEPLGDSHYTAVNITEVTTDEDHRDEVPEDGTTVQAYIHLTLGTTEDTARAATYALTLETRGGRWEVRNLEPAPALHPETMTIEPDSPDEDTPTNTTPTPAQDTEDTPEDESSSE